MLIEEEVESCNFTENIIYSNTRGGIEITTQTNIAKYNLFWNNYIYDNEDFEASDEGILNKWNNTDIGNYWGDYETKVIGAADADDDGIGDDPYPIGGSANAEDYLPIYEDGYSGANLMIDDLPTSMNNWSWAVQQTWCSGSGSEEDPYIIEPAIIDAAGSGSCIEIRNSVGKYFEIMNCFLNNSGTGLSDAGISLYNVSYGTIEACNITNHPNSGILMDNCSQNTILSNSFGFNNIGLNLSESCSNNIVSDNNFTGNGNYGLTIGSETCESNLIYLNEFRANGDHHAMDNSNANDNLWDNGTHGNFWDDYLGYDNNADGIGDQIYEILGSADAQDNYPIWSLADTLAPVIIIDSPLTTDKIYDEAPRFTITITERFLEEAWYTIDGGINNYSLVNPSEGTQTGTINQTAWDLYGYESILIEFYANDTNSNIGKATVTVKKSIPPTKDDTSSDDDEESPEGLPWFIQAALTGAISASVVIVLKQLYSSRKKRNEILEEMAKNMERIDNLENFFEKNLPPDDWDKFKEAWKMYKNDQITQKELLLQGKKNVGERFLSLFGITTLSKKAKDSKKDKTRLQNGPISKTPIESPLKDAEAVKELETKLGTLQKALDRLDVDLSLGEITESEYNNKAEYMKQKRSNLLKQIDELKENN